MSDNKLQIEWYVRYYHWYEENTIRTIDVNEERWEWLGMESLKKQKSSGKRYGQKSQKIFGETLLSIGNKVSPFQSLYVLGI